MLPKQGRGMYDSADDEEEEEEQQPALQQLDLKQLGELVAAAEPTLKHVEGQNVVILLGKTGTGKSTLIQAIAGRRLLRKQYQMGAGVLQDARGLDGAGAPADACSKVVYVAEDPLDGFSIGHNQESQTKKLRHYKRTPAGSGDDVVYLDSSGYEDTAGIAVDIATSISLRKVAERCKCLRFVVLINVVSFYEDRGGALRGLVKLVSTFVKDFEQHKFAFTFLFTHTDDLNLTAGNEINLIKAKLVKSILGWQLACLKKRFPFVDVFHPELSDVNDLIRAFEKFLPEEDGTATAIGASTGETPRGIICCGMTAQGSSSLKLELDSLLVKLGVELQASRMEDVASSWQTLSHLHQHMEHPLVRDAHRRAAQLVRQKADRVRGEFYRLLELGTTGTGNFSVANARGALQQAALLDALVHLTVGTGASAEDGQEAIAALRERLAALLHELIATCGGGATLPPLCGVQRSLEHLRAWAGAHAEFQPALEAGVAAVEALAERTVAEAARAAAHDVPGLVGSLARLEHVRAGVERLRPLGIVAAGVEDACKAAGAKVEDAVQEDFELAVQALGGGGQAGEAPAAHGDAEAGALRPRLDACRRRAEHLSELAEALKAAQVPEALATRAAHALNGLRAELKQECSRRAEALKGDVARAVAGAQLHGQLQALAMVVAVQKDASHEAVYNDCIGTIVAAVSEHCAQLDLLCNDLQTNGVGAPEIHRKLLSTLSGCVWLDSHKPPGGQSIACFLAATTAKYRGHFERIAGQAVTCLARYLDKPAVCNSQLAEAQRSLTEVDKVCTVQSGFAAAQCQIYEQVMRLLDVWRRERSCESGNFPVRLSQLQTLRAAAVDETLVVCESLQGFAPAVTEMTQQLSVSVHHEMQRLGGEIEALSGSRGQHSAKQEVLDTLAQWEKYQFAALTAMLPRLATLRQAARDEVQQLARSIRKMIDDSSDMAEVEAALAPLEEARCIDEHVENQVSHELNSLTVMLEMKRAQIDDRERARIEACDFEGMHEQLVRLAQSKNKMKKSQFKERMDAIKASVASQFSLAARQIESGEQVIETISVLEKVEGDVGKLLQRRNLNVAEELKKLKRKVANHFEKLLAHLETALAAQDYRGIATWHNSAVAYYMATERILGHDAYVRAAQDLWAAQKSPEAVDSLIEAFVSNIPKPSRERADTSMLVVMLEKLRAASSDGQAPMAEQEQPAQGLAAGALARGSRLWVVTGGASTGGIRVWRDKDMTQKPKKVEQGSVVKELSLVDGCLRFERLAGQGPATGWVRTKVLKGALLVRADDVWKVEAAAPGATSESLSAQEGRDLNSSSCERRLPVNALVRQLELHGDRLRFETLTGSGPKTGWTSIKRDGKHLLCPLCGSVALSVSCQALDVSLRTLADHYQRATRRLGGELNQVCRNTRQQVEEDKVFCMAIEVYTYLKRGWEMGLKDHVRGLDFDIEWELEAVQVQQRQMNDMYKSFITTPAAIDMVWVPHFDQLAANARSWSPWAIGWGYAAEYKSCKEQLAQWIHDGARDAQAALSQQSYEAAGSNAQVVRHALTRLSVHIADPNVHTLNGTLEQCVRDALDALCEELVTTLSRSSSADFELFFARYCALVRYLAPVFPCITEASHKVHKQIWECLNAKVTELTSQLGEFSFVAASESIRVLRSLGHALTGIFALYYKEAPQDARDPWLEYINELCSSRFGGKALSEFGIHFAVLEVSPYASEDEIRKAYHRKSREHHSDKQKQRGIFRTNPEEMQKWVVAAKEALSEASARETYQQGLQRPFSVDISRLPGTLRDHVTGLLDDKSYGQIRRLLDGLNDLDLLADLACPPLDSARARSSIHGLVRRHVDRVRNTVQGHWDTRELKKLQHNIVMLELIETHFSGYSDIYLEAWSRDITKTVEQEIESLATKTRSYLNGAKPAMEASINDFALQLIFLGRILDELPRFKDFARMKINNVLETCQCMECGFIYLFKLGMVLEQGKIGRVDSDGKIDPEDQRIGKVIVNEFQQFKDVVTVMWNNETQAMQKDVSATVAGVTGTRVVGGCAPEDMPIDRPALLAGFETYSAEYDRLFHSWRAGRTSLADIPGSVIAKAVNLHPCSADQWSRAIKDAIPLLLAGVFAYFTISKSGDSYMRLLNAGHAGTHAVELAPDSSSASEEVELSTDSVLIRPHNVQVVTILRMFGWDAEEESLSSHLMQIRTGEGKSIILGACSVLLGLLGFSVRCVCYSEYLSQRDHNLFKDIFSAFGVSDRIAYSKITTFSEDTTAAKGNIRTLTLDLLRGHDLAASAGRAKATRATGLAAPEAHPHAASSLCAAATAGAGIVMGSPPTLAAHAEEILLVDEVDVFFGKDFYGQTHNQVALLAEPEVGDILRAIWEHRADATRPRKVLEFVKASPAYSALVHKFPEWDFLIDSEVSAMCHDLQHFNTPAYHYDHAENRIGYQAMDSICYDVVYGYRTAFAYLHEATKKNLRNADAALQDALQLRVSCGQFSYANIKPTRILGVSGTVEALGEYEWQVMNRYGIEAYSHLPSVYGASNFRFLDQAGGDPITVETSKDSYFLAITDQAHQKVTTGRAAIVFFEDSAWLNEYEASSYCRKLTNRNFLRESQTPEEKEYTIKKAATSGQATFTTAAFGRGTDFFCNDPRLQDCGGVHVIQAFFSAEKSEEIQIQGRTARQGKKGTYGLVLLQERLQEQLGVRHEQVKDKAPAELYKVLSRAREQRHNAECSRVEDSLQAAGARDALTHEYFDALLAGDRQLAGAKFRGLYGQLRSHMAQGGRGLRRSRMVCLSDATRSMIDIWDKTREHIQEMLRRIGEIGGDNLELAWVAYRDYNDRRNTPGYAPLLEVSDWTKDSAKLARFVGNIKCAGGGGNERDGEEAVEHALAYVRTLHAEEEVTRVLLIGDAAPHPLQAGQSIHGHVLQTDYRREAAEFARLGIPVYAFFLRDRARDAFQYIARATGGRAEYLDRPEKLVDVVCENALDDIGGSDLVAEYRGRYAE